MTTVVAPLGREQRITAIDTLRGFALLGILLMNIVAFGLFSSAYNNPTVTGGATGLNLGVWTVLHILAEGKMRCLFSMVFGASVILLTQRLDERPDGADIYYRRNIWLLVFGVAHAYLLWMGDILYPYALCAFVLYPFRKLSPRRLLTVGFVFLAATSAFYVWSGFDTRQMIEKGRAAEAAAKEGKKLTSEQEEAKGEYQRWRSHSQPSQEEIDKDIAQWRGNLWTVLKVRARTVYPFHAVPYFHAWNWDIWSMMFIGMGLMKTGVLSAQRSAGFYGLLVVIGYGIGIPVNTYTALLIIRSNFDPAVRNFTGSAYDIGRLSIALGHLGILMLLCRKGWFRWLTDRLGAVGQMALSNYIFQSVVCAFVFTAYGFSLYGQLQRYQLYYVVVSIWVVQMIISPIWLRHYQFGPLEWAWRSLTYWKRQPMKIPEPATQTAAA